MSYPQLRPIRESSRTSYARTNVDDADYATANIDKTVGIEGSAKITVQGFDNRNKMAIWRHPYAIMGYIIAGAILLIIIVMIMVFSCKRRRPIIIRTKAVAISNSSSESETALSSSSSGNTNNGQPVLRSVGGNCITDRECTNGLVCSLGQCRNGAGATCTGDSCPFGYSCVNGKCLGFTGAECTRENECADPFSCVGNTCQYKNCRVNTDCRDSNGSECIQGICVKGGNQTCVEPGQCGSQGSVPSECIMGRCERGAGQPCMNGQDCMSGVCNGMRKMCM